MENKAIKTYAIRILWALLATLVLFVAINWGYFQKIAWFYLNPPAPVEQPATPEETRVAPNRIWIRSLGIEAPVVYVEGRTEDDFQVALRSGVVHYPGTALPGKPGNAYYFGHSSDYPGAPGDYKTVFALLPQINNNDRVELSDSNGRRFVYEVADQFVAEPGDVHLLEQDLSKKQLTLQTSYPLGTALRRYIVVAYLVE